MKTKFVLLPFLALMLCLLAISCDDDSAERYACISIPGYGTRDYLALLDAKDPDQVYNAICNLASNANTVGRTLTEGAPTDGSGNHEEKLKDYETAKSVYAGIRKTLQAASLKVRLASVHFIKLMGGGYDKKDELVRLLLAVKSGDNFLDFELVSALNSLCSLDAVAGEKYIRSFLASPSWLVSRAAYGLVDANRNTVLRRELIGKYKAEKDEKEKLLLLTSLRSSYDKEFAAFIVEELTTTGNGKIRQTLLSILVNPAEIASSIALIDELYSNFSAAVTAGLAKSVYEDFGGDFSRALATLLLRKNYDFRADLDGREVALFKALYEGMVELDNKTTMDDSDKRKKQNLVAIENSVLENPALAASWNEYKAMQRKAWKVEYERLANEFIDNTSKLLEKSRVEERENIISRMEEDLELRE